MKKIDELLAKVNKINDEESYFDFPTFLFKLREALNLSRQVVADDLEMPYLKLFYLERGYFMKEIEEKILVDLSEYFGVPYNTMRWKHNEYLSNKLYNKKVSKLMY